MKKILVMLLFCFFLPLSTASAATFVNGELVDSKVINYRTLVPVRTVSQNLGAIVNWDDRTHTITVTDSNKVIKLVIGKKEALVNDHTQILETPATIINNSTYVPIRFIAESLGENVKWDGTHAHIGSKPTVPISSSNNYSNSSSSSSQKEEKSPFFQALDNVHSYMVQAVNALDNNDPIGASTKFSLAAAELDRVYEMLPYDSAAASQFFDAILDLRIAADYAADAYGSYNKWDYSIKAKEYALSASQSILVGLKILKIEIESL